MQKTEYSENFKKLAVQKILSRKGKTIDQVCEEIGITNPSYYDWKAKYGSDPGMKKPNRRPQDWNPSEKFKAVIEFEGLAPEQQGEFLRRSGLHSEHIASWKTQMESGLDSKGNVSTPESRAELSKLKSEVIELKRDLHRKDRALAETTALLVLKKKADLIWGTGENE